MRKSLHEMTPLELWQLGARALRLTLTRSLTAPDHFRPAVASGISGDTEYTAEEVESEFIRRFGKT